MKRTIGVCRAALWSVGQFCRNPEFAHTFDDFMRLKMNYEANSEVNCKVYCKVNHEMNCEVNRKVNCKGNCQMNQKVNCKVNREVNHRDMILSGWHTNRMWIADTNNPWLAVFCFRLHRLALFLILWNKLFLGCFSSAIC